jgi:23S rRNA G2069 N7-methylase RlmK/C1962 C5-methylase RlmI
MIYSDQTLFDNLVIEEINRRAKSPDVLVLFCYKSDLLNKIIEQTQSNITIISTDTNVTKNNRVDLWSEDVDKFIDLAKETGTKFDLVLLINPESYEMFEENHKEMIRTIQTQLLSETGILLFITHKKDFKLDGYIRPGADKLTKKVMPDELKEEKTFQAYAFYR